MLTVHIFNIALLTLLVIKCAPLALAGWNCDWRCASVSLVAQAHPIQNCTCSTKMIDDGKNSVVEGIISPRLSMGVIWQQWEAKDCPKPFSQVPISDVQRDSGFARTAGVDYDSPTWSVYP